MAIKFIRTDDRFIHGQVTTGWLRQTGISKVALVNDNIANNTLVMKLQKLSAGKDVQVTFFTMDKAIEAIKNGTFCESGDTFLLVESPTDLISLIDAGLIIDKVNLGNLHYEQGKTKITNWIFVNEEEQKALIKLDSLGIKLIAQWTVASDSVSINHWLVKNKNSN